MLSNKNAVITGASGGIGLACLDLFCKNHAEVYAFVREERTDFTDHVSGLTNQGAAIHVIECDMGSQSSIKEAVRTLTKYTRTVDILVNNAGMVLEYSPYHMTSIDKIKYIYEVNFFGQTVLTQYISRLMSRNKRGSIVNVSSVSAIDGTPGNYEYSSSKAAMIGATKVLAYELGEMGIRVNAVAPGITNTKMVGNMSEQIHNNTLNYCIMKRDAEPIEIANAILFLASDMSSYITGQILRVDGGLY